MHGVNQLEQLMEHRYVALMEYFKTQLCSVGTGLAGNVGI